MEDIVLCAASAYEEKYYLNPLFNGLPQPVKDELQIACVLFTSDVGGILQLKFDEEGTLFIKTEYDEGDLLYDDIGAGLKMKALSREKEELFTQLELYYKVVILKKGVDEL